MTVTQTREIQSQSTGSWRSTSPYLISITLAVIVSAYANYLKDRIDSDAFTLWGQAPGIYLPFVFFPITFVLWLACESHSPRATWTNAFLAGLGISWTTHYVLMRVHGDLYTHTIWLFPIILTLLAIKPPTPESAWLALRVLAWSALCVLILTFLLERASLVPEFFAGSESIVEFENANYWLPLRDVFGLDGRWHGPFSHATKTAFIGSFIVVIAITDKGWQKWPLLMGGLLTLMLTGGRGGYLALAAAVAVLIVFTRNGLLARVPVLARLAFAVAIGSLGALVLYRQGSLGLTGRMPLWEGYLDLWQQSPWIGIGQSGITEAPQIVTWMDSSWMDSHSIYVEEVTTFGVLGAVSIFASLTLGVAITAVSAWRGQPLPLAVFTLYLVAGTTDLLHDGWSVLAAPLLMLLLAVFTAVCTKPPKTNASYQQGNDPDGTSWN